MALKLNCDMGEGFKKTDKQVMPYIDMTNLACGFHAGDASTMKTSVKLALKHNVKIGAHPGYDDIENFGRISVSYTKSGLKALLLYQIGALNAICKSYGTKVSYVKPHGAMYNDMMNNSDIFKTIVKAISKYNKNLNLMILSTNENKTFKDIADKQGIKLIYEVFADRNYTDDGFLVSRSKKNAVISNTQEVIKRVQQLEKENIILSENGKVLKLQADTICVHGDNKKAVDLICSLNKLLKK